MSRPDRKLTDVEVMVIRRSSATCRELAAQYKISLPALWRARKGISYKNLPAWAPV